MAKFFHTGEGKASESLSATIRIFGEHSNLALSLDYIQDTGPMITTTVFFNSFVLYVILRFHYAKTKRNVRLAIKRGASDWEINKIAEGPIIRICLRYASTMVFMTLCLTFSTVLPLMYPILYFGTKVRVWYIKYNIIFFGKAVYFTDGKMALMACDFIILMVPYRCFVRTSFTQSVA